MAIGTTNFPASLDTATELIRAANDARGVIATGGATNSATTINITSVPSAAPADGIAVIVSATDDSVREIVSYTGKTGTTITGVTRNLESSGAKTWLAGDIVYFDVLTALSRAVLVNALIALETFALSSDGLRSVDLAVGSNAATNSSTSTYATLVSTTAVLPAGTWAITVLFSATFTAALGGGTTGEFRVGAPMVGTARLEASVSNTRTPCFATASGSIVSNGSTAITFTGEFRRSTVFGSDAVQAGPGAIVAMCRRIA